MKKQLYVRHPRLGSLKKYLAEGDEYTDNHLRICPDCRTALAVLRGADTEDSAASSYGQSEALVQRLASIPAMVAGPARRPVPATLISDSWRTPGRAPVRDTGRGVERRLRYRIKDVLIDLVVDRLGDKSECFLRVSRRGRPLKRLVLKLDRKKILPADRGFFCWTGKRPPRQLTIWSREIGVQLGNIEW